MFVPGLLILSEDLVLIHVMQSLRGIITVSGTGGGKSSYSFCSDHEGLLAKNSQAQGKNRFL